MTLNNATYAANIVAAAAARAATRAAAAAIGIDDVQWYGQYGRPHQRGFYRDASRRRIRHIERRLTAAGISPAALKEVNYMGFCF